MPIDDKMLYDLLKDNGFLSEKDLEKAKAESSSKKISLADALVDLDLLTDQNLGKLISDHLKLSFTELSKHMIPQQVLRVIPESVATRNHVIAFELTPQEIYLATSNPNQPLLFEMIGKKVRRTVKVTYATDRDLIDALHLYKKELQKAFDEILKSHLDEQGKEVRLEDVPVAQIVDVFIAHAYESRASDIHIEAMEDHSIVRFRIDGVLEDVLEIPPSLHSQIVTRIKVLSRLRTDEHLSAQDGRMQIKLPQEELDIRVSIVPIVEGEKVVMRLLTSHFRSFALTSLGMSEKDLEKVHSAFTKPYGMVLSTGPTGSGKTTSMYAVLKILNTRDKNIATIEDPVEYEIHGLNQIQVNPKTNLTFAEGLRSILRQDPDIIYVGEIRDEETAGIAVNSAMTGHLVLSTLHTNNAATTLPRLIDMEIEPFLVASTVNVIIGQRLIRKICDKCKMSFTQDVTELKPLLTQDILKEQFGKEKEVRLYKGKGCSVCHNTGYIGRVGIFEVLVVSSDIQDLITQKANAEVIMKKAVEEGMTTMLLDGIDKAKRGVTTLEEVLRATKE